MLNSNLGRLSPNDIAVQAFVTIGNGASMAVWDRFAYASLYDIAYPKNNRRTMPTGNCSRSFRTSNFEQATAQHQREGIRHPRFLYTKPTLAVPLIAAVNTVHIPWKLVQPATLTAIYEALRPYKTIFTTNYDLLVYWALMNAPSGTSNSRTIFGGKQLQCC